MGLLDKFKKTKEKPEIIVEERSGKIVFIKKIGSKEFKATKEEALLGIEEAKKKYEGKLSEKVNVMGMEIDVDTTKVLEFALNEAFIENYGTLEEIEELKLKQSIRESEKIASKLKNGNENDKQKAMKIYENNIKYGVPCASYSDLALMYQQKREYDKAIEVCKNGIGVYSKHGKDSELLELILSNSETSGKYHIWATNNLKGKELEEQGKVEEAKKCYEENVRFNADTPHTYYSLASIYHREYEFEKELETLKLYKERCFGSNPNRIPNDINESIENIEHFLNTGNWIFDCLPSDSKNVYYEIREAKSILKEDKEKGVEMLENIMEKGTFNNTVYNTLFQTYKKDKRFDEAIRVCEKAIEVLGFFSEDRKERWNINLEKSLKAKEKK